jgi:lactoylglutathione lyase
MDDEPMIEKVRTVFLLVADQDRALEFYTEKLGMEKVQDTEMWPGARWLEVAPRGAQTRLSLSAASDFNAEPGQSGGFTMSARNVVKLHEQLKANGVDVDELKKEAWATHFTLTDPDGNKIMVAES